MSTTQAVSQEAATTSCRAKGILGCSKSRTVLAGVAGGMAMSIAMLLTFRLIGFGWNADGILLHPDWQSPKLIAVWTKMEPLPLIISQPPIIILGLVLFGIGHSVVYRWLSSAWPKGVWPRAWRFSFLTLGMTFLFWEFFTPFNLFGEPLVLIGFELVFWSVVAFSEGIVLAFASEWLDGKTTARVHEGEGYGGLRSSRK